MQQEYNERKLTEAMGNVQRRFDEINRFIGDGENNLCLLLVKAYRHGLDPAHAEVMFDAIADCVKEAASTFTAAIAQPEPKIRAASRVNLMDLASRTKTK